jgi:hypothetical protein
MKRRMDVARNLGSSYSVHSMVKNSSNHRMHGIHGLKRRMKVLGKRGSSTSVHSVHSVVKKSSDHGAHGWARIRWIWIMRVRGTFHVEACICPAPLGLGFGGAVDPGRRRVIARESIARKWLLG